MTNALDVQNLAVRFEATEVFHDLSFSVPRGTCLAVIGPNGAGKTVLFKALIGSIPHEGTISWAPGTKLGYVPQKLDIERDLPLTGRDFLRAKAAIVKASDTSIRIALNQVGLDHAMLSTPIGNMSGGRFQRLLVAFALIGNPNVLLLDEPAAGIDEPGQERLNAMIGRLQAEKDVTVLLISHDLSVVYEYATAVLCLSKTHPCFGAPRKVLTPENLRDLYGAASTFHVHDQPGN
ncbi:MAG TPA: metal ABC transporter ATP-binding protein [Candidatus Binataceae bacterium]|nr:metal ABC transporter ATP-binding protein [Candidatus Binataceae bacterium]